MPQNKDFEAQVRDEYYTLKSMTAAAGFKYDDLDKELRRSFTGCLFAPLLWITGPIGRRALEKESEKRGYGRFESQADEIVGRSEVKTAICDALQNLPKDRILTEETFVKVAIEVLLSENFDATAIPEPKLFAIVIFKIFSNGIENYCN